MRHKTAVLSLAFVGVTALTIAWGFYRNSRIDARFGGVTVGAADIDVVRLLSRPSWTEPCGKSFGSSKPNCTEYIYRNSFAPLIPEYHSVSLDGSGHVVDKYVYSSPYRN
jgi:hypothetical protein